MSFIAHMVASLKHNKRERVSAFKKMENFKEGRNIKVTFNNKATPYKLNKIRTKIKLENKKKLKKNLIFFVMAMLLLIYVIGFVKY